MFIKKLAKKTPANIIFRYRKAFFETEASLGGKGLGNYLLGNIHRSIVRGTGPIALKQVRGHVFAGLSHTRLGLRGNPYYLNKLQVRLNKYFHARHALKIKGIAEASLKHCRIKSKKRRMPAIVKQVKTKFAAMAKSALAKLVKGAHKAIKKSPKFAIKPRAGVQGAKSTLKKTGDLTVPSAKEIRKQAAKAAWNESLR